MQDAEPALLALAAGLAQQAGALAPVHLTQLAGGRNNRVYLAENADGSRRVLKRYFSHPGDPRDRLGAEWGFITAVWTAGLRCVPEPLAQDADARAALYGFVAGRKLAPGEIGADHVVAAADFVGAINRQPLPGFAPASEACFSIQDHLAVVDRRLARLQTLDPQAPQVHDAAMLVAGRLRPAWDAARMKVEAGCRALGLAIAAPLPEEERCLSPSDFGFHNALLDEGQRLVFLDFEYAGQDDPAKLALDFTCQPEIPVPSPLHALWDQRLAAHGVLTAPALARCRLLRDVCRLKWVCIMLNDFLPVGDARRGFANDAARAARCAAQLTKAGRALDALAA
jgi:hypothetical protein